MIIETDNRNLQLIQILAFLITVTHVEEKGEVIAFQQTLGMYKRNTNRNYRSENIITKIKNSIDEFNGRLATVSSLQKKINEVEDSSLDPDSSTERERWGEGRSMENILKHLRDKGDVLKYLT